MKLRSVTKITSFEKDRADHWESYVYVRNMGGVDYILIPFLGEMWELDPARINKWGNYTFEVKIPTRMNKFGNRFQEFTVQFIEDED